MKHGFEFKYINGVGVLVPAAFENAGTVKAFFSSRIGGVSEDCYASLNLSYSSGDSRDKVDENYRRFFSAIGCEASRAVASCQVHEGNVKKVSACDMGNGFTKKNRFLSADGLVTNERGIALLIFYADCVPVLLYDGKKGVISAVHSGWRGTVEKIAENAVSIMKHDYGCDPTDIIAAIGPHIQKCCYEVSNDVAQSINSAYDNGEDLMTRTGNGKFMLDLDKAVYTNLVKGGLREENIYSCKECTSCRNDIYFSHRAQKGKKGIMSASIMLV